MIIISKEQHKYILDILNYNKELKTRLIQSLIYTNNAIKYYLNDDLEIDFKDFLEDKQIEIGYDKNYNPNDEWEKIQNIIDLIDNQ